MQECCFVFFALLLWNSCEASQLLKTERDTICSVLLFLRSDQLVWEWEILAFSMKHLSGQWDK